jgi:hypothetical protein
MFAPSEDRQLNDLQADCDDFGPLLANEGLIAGGDDTVHPLAVCGETLQRRGSNTSVVKAQRNFNRLRPD